MLSSASGQKANRIEADIDSILSIRPSSTVPTVAKSRFRVAAGTMTIVLIIGVGIVFLRPDILPWQVSRATSPLPQTARPSAEGSPPSGRAVTVQLNSLTINTPPVYAPPTSASTAASTKRASVSSDISGVRIADLPPTPSVDQPSTELPTSTESSAAVPAPPLVRLTPSPSLSVPSVATTANSAPLGRTVEPVGSPPLATLTKEAEARALRQQALDAVRALRKQ